MAIQTSRPIFQTPGTFWSFVWMSWIFFSPLFSLDKNKSDMRWYEFSFTEEENCRTYFLLCTLYSRRHEEAGAILTCSIVKNICSEHCMKNFDGSFCTSITLSTWSQNSCSYLHYYIFSNFNNLVWFHYVKLLLYKTIFLPFIFQVVLS